MAITFKALAVVRAPAAAFGTVDGVCRADFRFSFRKIWKQDLALLTVNACKEQIPLAGGQGPHHHLAGRGNRRRGRGVPVLFPYKFCGLMRSIENRFSWRDLRSLLPVSFLERVFEAIRLSVLLPGFIGG